MTGLWHGWAAIEVFRGAISEWWGYWRNGLHNMTGLWRGQPQVVFEGAISEWHCSSAKLHPQCILTWDNYDILMWDEDHILMWDSDCILMWDSDFILIWDNDYISLWDHDYSDSDYILMWDSDYILMWDSDYILTVSYTHLTLPTRRTV